MTLLRLYLWHREQAERFSDLARSHKTCAARVYRAAVSRRYGAQSEFHAQAALALRPVLMERGELAGDSNE